MTSMALDIVDEDDSISKNGTALPRILQLKLKRAKIAGMDESTNPDDAGDGQNDHASKASELGMTFDTGSESPINHVSYLNRCAAAISQIQGVIYRMEESYHDETHSRGNLYRGLEIMLDMKLSAASSGSGGLGSSGGGSGLGSGVSGAVGGGGSGIAAGTKRRMTQEERWFSSSCGSVPPPNARVGGRGRSRHSTSSAGQSNSPTSIVDAAAKTVVGAQLAPSVESLFNDVAKLENKLSSNRESTQQVHKQTFNEPTHAKTPKAIDQKKKSQYTTMTV